MFKKENLRKNLLRVKQIADQNLGRVEKTEVLSDDLQTSEKRVETVKHVTSNTVKKLSVSLLGAGSTDAEKRLKKMPEAMLGHCMIESASILGTECVMGQLYQMCGDCQNNLAQRHLNSEFEIEKNVLDPLQAIVETEIPQILKLKKALNKVTLDMDSAKSRHQSALRQAQQPGVNMVTASAKVDLVKDELEDTLNRVDQARDAYTTEMFNFMSREADQSQNLLTLIEAQASYHRKCLEIIDKYIPRMKEALSCNPTKPVYGIALEEHLRVSNRDIAQVLEACICYLLDEGLDEEGLFRIAGMASKVKKLKASFDAGVEIEENKDLDPHTVAGALKQYLRELPEPLLTFKLFPDFMAAAQQQADQRLQALWCVVDRLPKPNYDNFRYLIKFLSKLTERSDVNKMTPSNIAIVIGPNLIWSEGDSGPNMMNTGILSLITELIVQHADWFFPGAQDFHATLRDNAPEHRRRKSSAFLHKPGHLDNNTKASVAVVTAQQQQLPSSSQSSRRSKGTFSPKVSQDSVSSSSESTSLSDASTHMKDYENADTLERRDSTDHYLTARGDLNESSTESDTRMTNKRTNPIITFDPNERHKNKPSVKRRAPKPSLEIKPVQQSGGSPQLSAGHNVHSDMYSTAFALQSLGDGGTWPKYLNTVRSMWDDQLQIKGNTDLSNVGNSQSGQARSNQEINFGVTSPTESPASKPGEVREKQSLERTSSNQSSSSHGTPQSSPAGSQETSNPFGPPQTPPTASRSPSVSPAASNTNLTGPPVAERIEQNRHIIKRRPSVPPKVPPKR
ncbi:Rho GTPase-activating protein 17 [Mactra antiquata]